MSSTLRYKILHTFLGASRDAAIRLRSALELRDWKQESRSQSGGRLEPCLSGLWLSSLLYMAAMIIPFRACCQAALGSMHVSACVHQPHLSDEQILSLADTS